MAIITWQNVPIPQFLGIQQGIANASQFLNRATHSGLGALNLIQRHMQDQADRAILDRMLAIQDPQEYARQMEQGAILGPERGRASLDTILAAGKYLDTLQARADARYKSERTRKLDEDRDRISKEANAALAEAIGGDPRQGALKLMEAEGHIDNTLDIYKLLFQGALQQDANEARRDAARIRTGPAYARYQRELLIEGLAGELFDYRDDPEYLRDLIARLPEDLRAPVLERIWKLGEIESKAERTQEADDQRYLDNLLGEQTMEGGSDDVDRSNIIQSNSYLSPSRRNSDGSFTRFGAYNRMVSDGKIPQADGSIVDITSENVYDGRPIERLLGSEIEALQRLSIEVTKSADPRWRKRMGLSKGQGTSAMGKYQLTHGAMFGNGKNGLVHRIWGDDWKNVYLMAPENQEKMGRLLFEQYQDKGLTKAWAALPPVYGDPEFTKRLTWEDVRLVIATFESGYRPPSFEREIKIVKNRLRQAQMSPIGLAFQEAEKNQDMSLQAVVTEILKTEGVKKHFNRKEIHNILSKYLEENQELTPAQAGAIFLHTYGELDPNALFQKDRVNRIIKQMQTTGKAELEEQRQIKEYLKKIEDTEKKYKLAYKKAYGPRGAVKGLQRNPDSRDAAIYAQRALAEVERYSQELEYLIFDAPLAALSQKVKKKEKENEKNNPLDEWSKAIGVQEELYPGRPGAGIPGGFETAGAISF